MRAVWNFIITKEIELGTQFLVASGGAGELYAVLGETQAVIRLSASGRGGAWHHYCHTAYGIGEREAAARFVYDALRAYAFEHGTHVELRRFSAFNTNTRTGYLSAYNGRMWKLDGAAISVETVGEDGVFFADDDGGLPVADVDIGNHGILLDRLTDINFAPCGLSGITPTQQRMALIVWIFALAFPDLMPTKPILLLEGTQGAGKSASMQLLQLALMGAARPMILSRNKEDDFGVLLLRSPIAVFDNTDSYIEWVPDAICAYTTAGLWNKRKLFTDDESMTIRPHAFIAIASKNPASFRREDVADRCVILRLERRSVFTSFQALKESIATDRPRLLGEYLWYVGQIIEALRAGAGATEHETHRMADFAALARVVGHVLGWAAQDVSDLMLALQGERDAFINEEDPLIDLLVKWVGYRRRDGRANFGRLITATELHTELGTLAAADQIELKYSARTLAQKIRSPHIERVLHVESSVVGGHKAYKFWRHTDPRLEIVPAEPMITEE